MMGRAMKDHRPDAVIVTKVFKRNYAGPRWRTREFKRLYTQFCIFLFNRCDSRLTRRHHDPRIQAIGAGADWHLCARALASGNS